MTDLSIVILSYNTADITRKCIKALVNVLVHSDIKSEIIVVDNNSTDGSADILLKIKREYESEQIRFKLIFNKSNKGYTGGNNQGFSVASGKYILLLNSDAIIRHIDFRDLLSFMDKNKDVGVLTVRVVLPNGQIDPASHRGFPTIWNSFTYFAKLEKMFGRIPILSSLFGGYHLTYMDLSAPHEIDSPTGAFYLTTKKIIEVTEGLDEDFFMYGEDLDLSYRIKSLGYKILYFPKYEVLHLKRASGLKKEDNVIRNKTREYFYNSMKIFYKKHYSKIYPQILNSLVYFLIDLKKKIS